MNDEESYSARRGPRMIYHHHLLLSLFLSDWPFPTRIFPSCWTIVLFKTPFAISNSRTMTFVSTKVNWRNRKQVPFAELQSHCAALLYQICFIDASWTWIGSKLSSYSFILRRESRHLEEHLEWKRVDEKVESWGFFIPVCLSLSSSHHVKGQTSEHQKRIHRSWNTHLKTGTGGLSSRLLTDRIEGCKVKGMGVSHFGQDISYDTATELDDDDDDQDDVQYANSMIRMEWLAILMDCLIFWGEGGLERWEGMGILPLFSQQNVLTKQLEMSHLYLLSLQLQTLL